MPNVITNIAPVVAGEESLVSAKRANELIDAINAIRAGTVAPAVNVGKFSCTANQFILDLSLFDNRLKAVEDRLNAASINASGACSGNNITINISLNI